MHFVYALTDPRTDCVHYIGITNDVSRRYQEHYKSKDSDHSTKDEWIRGLKRERLVPGLKILDVTDTEDAAMERERYWIRRYQELGNDLVNTLLVRQPLETSLDSDNHVVDPTAQTRTQFNPRRLRLAYWRTRRAMNIRNLAKASNVSSTTIVRIENDQKYLPRPDVINKLANALKISVDELLVDGREGVSPCPAA